MKLRHHARGFRFVVQWSMILRHHARGFRFVVQSRTTDANAMPRASTQSSQRSPNRPATPLTGRSLFLRSCRTDPTITNAILFFLSSAILTRGARDAIAVPALLTPDSASLCTASPRAPLRPIAIRAGAANADSILLRLPQTACAPRSAANTLSRSTLVANSASYRAFRP